LLAVFRSTHGTRRAATGLPVPQCGRRGGRIDAGEFKRLCAASKRSFIDRLTELAKQAGARDPQLLGYELGVLYEGWRAATGHVAG